MEHARDRIVPGARPANVVLVRGVLQRPTEERLLRSGDRVVEMQILANGPTPRESVPVVWPDAPAAVVEWREGDEVLVLGRVRQRFFRSGGSTQSRTEVVADVVNPTRRTVKVRSALVDAAERLNGFL